MINSSYEIEMELNWNEMIKILNQKSKPSHWLFKSFLLVSSASPIHSSNRPILSTVDLLSTDLFSSP